MRILVTSALPYANGEIHFGHLAGAYLPADIYVRYQRLKKRDVIYICGTDEHGVPITITADREKKTPREIVDRYFESIKKSFEDFGIKFDNFSRTTLPLHYKFSQNFFLKIYEKGYIFPKETKQFYCPNCQKFLADRYILGTCPHCSAQDARGDQCEACGRWLEPFNLIDPHCQICNTTPKERITTHWYFKLSAFDSQLREWLATKTHWKDNVKKFCDGWLKEGLEDRPITRDLSWGVPVPLSEAVGKVLYVWFDAPIGYISSTIEWAENMGEPEAWKRYWLDPETKLVHFIGKDNIVFHALVWPAMLMAHGDYILPTEIPANEFLNIESAKISTSRGHAIWLPDYLKEFAPDPLRYYLTINAPETRDSDFTWQDFKIKHNNELANVLGNFVNRSMAFVTKYYNRHIPTSSNFDDRAGRMVKIIEEAPDAIGKMIEHFEFKKAMKEIMNIAHEGNKYFDHDEPWNMRKTSPLYCERTIYVCMKLISMLQVIIEPFLPFTAQKIASALKLKDRTWDEAKTAILPGELGEVEILFPKIETITLQKPKEVKELIPEITLEEFKKVDLRVAKILKAENVTGTEKLMKMEVEVGNETRQIVAGIARNYKAEELVGKYIVIVYNLKPARIFNVESKGMLLAAVKGDEVILISPEKPIDPGAKIS
ncbi:MAG: methionine--tRNA ligase [candidate division WOR-3 bacterium]